MSLLHPSPAVGFDQPFDMLEACHERVERSLNLLLRLAEHLGKVGPDGQARAAAGDLLRYFDIAAPQHHEDEERHVLPRLRALGRGELAERIAAEHRLMHERYQAIRPGLLALRDHGLPPDCGAWSAFATLYREHIALEEGDAYPASRQGLSSEQQSAMGDEMAARRRQG